MRIIRAGHRFVKMVMGEERGYSKEFFHASKPPIFIGDFRLQIEHSGFNFVFFLMLARSATATYDCHADVTICLCCCCAIHLTFGSLKNGKTRYAKDKICQRALRIRPSQFQLSVKSY